MVQAHPWPSPVAVSSVCFSAKRQVKNNLWGCFFMQKTSFWWERSLSIGGDKTPQLRNKFKPHDCGVHASKFRRQKLILYYSLQNNSQEQVCCPQTSSLWLLQTTIPDRQAKLYSIKVVHITSSLRKRGHWTISQWHIQLLKVYMILETPKIHNSRPTKSIYSGATSRQRVTVLILWHHGCVPSKKPRSSVFTAV